MKSFLVETYPGATIQLLESKKFVYCDLYTITTAAGPQFRYTTADIEVGYVDPTYGMVNFTSQAVRFDTVKNKALCHWATGLNVDTWKMEIFPANSVLMTTGPVSYVENIIGYALFGAITTTVQSEEQTQPNVLSFATWALGASSLANVTDPTTYVTDLYQMVLKRTPDAQGLQAWINALNSGAQTRAQVLVGFASSPEALNHYYSGFVWGLPLLQAIAGGVFDGATVYVDRAYFNNWPAGPPWPSSFSPYQPVGVMPIFSGRIAEVDVGRSSAVITINSFLELMTQQMPRNLYQAACQHTLFDVGCSLNRWAFSNWGTVAAGSTNDIIIASVPGPPGSGTYTLGNLYMATGENAGFSRGVRWWGYAAQYNGYVFSLIAPFNFTIQAGDTFVASAGCDKTLAACQLFNNSTNFGGTPFIPTPETAA